MRAGLTVNSKALLSCFFEECERQFRFLELDHGFHYISGLANIKAGRQIISAYNNQIIDPPFWAVTRYEGRDIALELAYGDAGYRLESHIYCGTYQRFEWAEILRALKKDDEDARAVGPITNKVRIAQTVSDLARIVRDNTAHLTAPTDALIQRAAKIRSTRIQEQIRKSHQRQITEASRLAAKAMARGDHRRVVELLRPYEAYLSRMDKAKLKHAREKLMKA